jgi:hypothetical protein
LGGNQGIRIVPPPANLYALPANRVITWMPGLSYAPTSGQYAPALPPAGWTGGIPTNYTQSGSTYSPSGGDDTAAINALLVTAGAAASQSTPKYVKLSTGTFTISSHGIVINSAYVELRGSGVGDGMTGALSSNPSSSDCTLLVKTDASPYPVVTIGSVLGSGAGILNTMSATSGFTSDCVAGTNSAVLSSPGSVSAMAVGEMVYIDELFDPNLIWFNEGAGQGSGFRGWGENGNAASDGASRPIGQAMEVASFNSGTGAVTFTTNFAQTYRTAFSCHLGRINPTNRVNWSGVSNLFMTGGGGGDGGGNLCIASAMYCWCASVESAGHTGQFGGSCVHLFNSFRCEVRDSYFHSVAADIPNVAPGGGYYNITLDAFVSDSLIENCISWVGNKVIVMRSVGSGNVVGYCYMDDGYGSSYQNQMETGLNQNHMAGSHHTLFEGNYCWQLGSESRWGNTTYPTWFRNWGTGMRVSAWPSTLIPTGSTASGSPLIGAGYVDSFNRNPVKASSYSFWYNYVGNVLGYPGSPTLSGQVTSYEQYGPSTPGSVSESNVPMWTMGISDSGEQGSGGNADFTGYISGTVLTVTTDGGGSLLEPGLGFLTGGGTGIIASFGTGTGRGTGTYNCSVSQTVGSAGSPVAMTANYLGNGLNQVVLPKTLRDANFDYFTGAVHWHGIGGSGTGQTTPPGASTGGTVLPNSLYMTSKPAWFHSYGWPWVDGSNASNPIPGTLPAQARFNAGTPNAI